MSDVDPRIIDTVRAAVSDSVTDVLRWGALFGAGVYVLLFVLIFAFLIVNKRPKYTAPEIDVNAASAGSTAMLTHRYFPNWTDFIHAKSLFHNHQWTLMQRFRWSITRNLYLFDALRWILVCVLIIHSPIPKHPALYQFGHFILNFTMFPFQMKNIFTKSETFSGSQGGRSPSTTYLRLSATELQALANRLSGGAPIETVLDRIMDMPNYALTSVGIDWAKSVGTLSLLQSARNDDFLTIYELTKVPVPMQAGLGVTLSIISWSILAMFFAMIALLVVFASYGIFSIPTLLTRQKQFKLTSVKVIWKTCLAKMSRVVGTVTALFTPLALITVFSYYSIFSFNTVIIITIVLTSIPPVVIALLVNAPKGLRTQFQKFLYDFSGSMLPWTNFDFNLYKAIQNNHQTEISSQERVQGRGMRFGAYRQMGTMVAMTYAALPIFATIINYSRISSVLGWALIYAGTMVPHLAYCLCTFLYNLPCTESRSGYHILSSVCFTIMFGFLLIPEFFRVSLNNISLGEDGIRKIIIFAQVYRWSGAIVMGIVIGTALTFLSLAILSYKKRDSAFRNLLREIEHNMQYLSGRGIAVESILQGQLEKVREVSKSVSIEGAIISSRGNDSPEETPISQEDQDPSPTPAAVTEDTYMVIEKWKMRRDNPSIERTSTIQFLLLLRMKSPEQFAPHKSSIRNSILMAGIEKSYVDATLICTRPYQGDVDHEVQEPPKPTAPLEGLGTLIPEEGTTSPPETNVSTYGPVNQRRNARVVPIVQYTFSRSELHIPSEALHSMEDPVLEENVHGGSAASAPAKKVYNLSSRL